MIRWRTFLCKIPGVCTSVVGVLFPLALPTDTTKIRFNSPSLLAPKENSSSAISNVEAANSESQQNCFMIRPLFFLSLTPPSCPQILISMDDFKMVEHSPQARSKKDSTNVPTNFNLQILDDEFIPLISAVTPKLPEVGAEHQKYHEASSTTNQTLLSLKSHKWKRYFADISKYCFNIWIIKIKK